MTLFDHARKMLDQARSYADRNSGKVHEITDKAAKFADQRTHGKYHKQIDDAVRKIDGFVDRDRKPGGGAQDPRDR